MKLEGRDLAVTLSGRPVLDAVSAACATGEIVGVIGPNGAGKSTLLKTLAGVVAPDRGQVLIDGADALSLPRAALAHHLAYLPQSRTVHWPVTVETLVGLGRLPFHGFAIELNDADRAAVAKALAATETVHLAKRLTSELSGGELARVLVARALAQEPKFLIADEPSAGLDPAHQLALFRHLRALAEGGMGVMVALHDLSAAARFCHRLWLLKDGVVVADDRPEAVLTPALLKQAFDVTAVRADIEGIPVVIAH